MVFKATMELRHKPIYRGVDFEGDPVMVGKHLQQKFINTSNGLEEWRDIKITN